MYQFLKDIVKQRKFTGFKKKLILINENKFNICAQRLFALP